MKHIVFGSSRFKYIAEPFPAYRCHAENGAESIIVGLSYIRPVETFTVRVKYNVSDVVTITSSEKEAERVRDQYNQTAEYSSAEIVKETLLPEGKFHIIKTSEGQYVAVSKNDDHRNHAFVFIGCDYSNLGSIEVCAGMFTTANVLATYRNHTKGAEHLDIMAVMRLHQRIVLMITSIDGSPAQVVVYKLIEEGLICDTMLESELRAFLAIDCLDPNELPPGAVYL